MYIDQSFEYLGSIEFLSYIATRAVSVEQSKSMTVQENADDSQGFGRGAATLAELDDCSSLVSPWF